MSNPTNTLKLVGKRFGRLRVVKRAGSNRYGMSLWQCLCDCGDKKVVRGTQLKHGAVKNCGCLVRESSQRPGRGTTRWQDGKVTSEYAAWRNMRARCLNPKHPDYETYGGCGVSICNRWNPRKGGSFENFLSDLGSKPTPKSDYSIGRFLDLGNYEPGNCKWMTWPEQAKEKQKRHELLKRQGAKNLSRCKHTKRRKAE